MRSEKRPPPKAFSGDGHFRTNGTPPPGAPLDGKPPTDAIKDFVLELKALRRYGLDLVAARVGRTRAKLKLLLVLACLGVVAAFVVLAAAAMATALLLQGLAGGLAAAFGGHPWLGDLAAGALTLGCLAVGGWITVKWVQRVRKTRTEIRKEAEERDQAKVLAEGLRR
jgi:uncharacterized YccA/Bax inhibitor family protein